MRFPVQGTIHVMYMKWDDGEIALAVCVCVSFCGMDIVMYT